jgi:hypothetical protein
MNLGSRSDTMLSGRPNLVNMSSWINSNVSSAELFSEQGINVASLVSLYTTTKMALKPSMSGKPTKESMETDLKSVLEIGTGCNRFYGLCMVALET